MADAVVGRFTKSWEGQDPFLVLQIQTRRGEEHVKGYLVVDARARKVEATRTKPEGLKPSGSVASLLRKHAASGGLGRLLRGVERGDVWIPLFTERTPEPSFYLHLDGGSPAEISLVSAARQALVRRSSKGTYTKLKAWEGPLPHEQSDAATAYRDVTDELLAALGGEESPAPEAVAPAAAPPTETALLAEYQRTARDRLARRVKTLKKSLVSRKAKGKTDGELASLERQAKALGENLHRVREGDYELVVDDVTVELDPDKSPGHNLDDLFVRIKKTRKGLRIDEEQAAGAQSQLAAMEEDLLRLRAAPLSFAEALRIMTRHKLPMERETQRTESGKAPVAQPWRTYQWRDGELVVPLLVGKTAAGNDDLCRAARSNDWWLHAVGTTGSHVLIPAKALRGAAPAAGLVRAGAILALHFSPRRDDRRGEVYLTKRQFLKKRPGMAPGLWQVDKAEHVFFSYGDDELKSVLDTLAL
jgi:hypothetical protein